MPRILNLMVHFQIPVIHWNFEFLLNNIVGQSSDTDVLFFFLLYFVNFLFYVAKGWLAAEVASD